MLSYVKRIFKKGFSRELKCLPPASNQQDPYKNDKLNNNIQNFLKPEELGSASLPYKPTHDFNGPYINKSHAFYNVCPVKEEILIDLGIPGWLRREDALKIYELAYFSPGDILELGTYQGLSTSIISTANKDSGFRKNIITVDLNPECTAAAKRYLKYSLLKNIYFHSGDAAAFSEELIKKGYKFSFIFIDHSHEYGPVLEICKLLDKLVTPRGFCLFHDFNDSRNNDPENMDYGVSKAVYDGLPMDSFQFYGIFGCTALYRANL